MKALLGFLFFLSLCSFISADRNDSISNFECNYSDSPETIPQSPALPNIYCFKTDKFAEFIGGDSALTAFLDNNLVYPDSAFNNKISGRVVVEFIINIDGSIKNELVKKSSGNQDLDQEALRVVRLTNGHWLPAIMDGIKVKSFASLPFTFQFSEE